MDRLCKPSQRREAMQDPAYTAHPNLLLKCVGELLHALILAKPSEVKVPDRTIKQCAIRSPFSSSDLS